MNEDTAGDGQDEAENDAGLLSRLWPMLLTRSGKPSP
jgi:hypothetical protein